MKLDVTDWPIVQNMDTGQWYLAREISSEGPLAPEHRHTYMMPVEPLESTALRMLARHFNPEQEDE